MFIARLKKSLKSLMEPIIWIGIVVAIMYGLYNYNWMMLIFKWALLPIGVIGGGLLVGLMLWVWVDWQFVEPYKNYKNNKTNNI